MYKWAMVILGLASIAASPRSAGTVEYWPTSDGTVYRYENDRGETMEVTFSDGVRESRISSWYGTGWMWESYQVDESGDLLLAYEASSGTGTVETCTFLPPLLFLDLPLAAGHGWHSQTTPYGYGVCPSFVISEVTGPATVEVPMGQFEVLVLQRYGIPVGGGVYYLHREIGPVILPGGYKLVSVTGVVPVSNQTWGGVKGLYR